MTSKEQILEEIPYRFKISGNIIKKLGEESIANKNVAVLELIKNSFDAKSTKVEIRLENLGSTQASIIVSDNGDGMTSTDLENKWLNIATPNKAEKKIRTGERIPVGEKGIGRLSSESLGEQTILFTKPKNELAAYKVVFDWNKYLDKNALANEIVNDGYKLKKKKNESGTSLEISKLRHDWNDSLIQKSLLKDLYLLHPPNQKPKNFIVNTNIKISDLPKIDKKFLELAAYKLKVSLIQGNILKYEIKSISGESKKDELKLDKKLKCGDCSFEFYYYYRSLSALKDSLGFESTNVKIKEANNILDEYCGVKIYRDGFRVKPYGEEGNDWLNLDIGYQNNTMLPRNTNVFGYVNISKLKNPKISDTTTREGIVLTDEFQDLITFLKVSIGEIFVTFRSEVESHKKKAKKIAKSKKPKKVAAVPPPSTTVPTVSEKLIQIGGTYPQSFYAQLESEINDCYKNNFPNASFFLSRKLIENLIFNILEKKFPSDINLWYNTSTKSHHKLSQLISNLYSKRADFKPNAQNYINKFNTDVGYFRKEANAKAHNIFEYLRDKSELKKFKINDLVQLLLNIYNTI